MYAWRRAAVVAVLAVVSVTAVVALPAPNHLKVVVVDKDPVVVSPHPSVAVAGLAGGNGGLAVEGGGQADGGGGQAVEGGGQAVEGGGQAVEGGGQAVGSTVHKPSKPIHGGPTFFDNIFNIPISVLQSVNTYLNNRGPVIKPVHPHPGHPQSHPPPPPPPPPMPDREAQPAEASEESATGVQHPHQPTIVRKRVDYDAIFNIPISALKSVNQLLNGHGKK